LAAWLAAAIHYRLYDTFAYVLYGISMLLLVAVLAVRTSRDGRQSAGSSSDRSNSSRPRSPRSRPCSCSRAASTIAISTCGDQDWCPALHLTLMPFALVAKEPDLGTSLSFR
jgi:cell division protein FtsW (lipid II flippase)